MTLRELIQHAFGTNQADLPEADVRGVVQDSRRVQPGFVFVARSGDVTNGHQFVPAALVKGAVAVVGDAPESERVQYPWHDQVPYIQVDDAKAAIATLAATFYRHPSRALFTLGVTGTDGKTTTSYLLHHLLMGRHPTGLLSTAGVKAGDKPLALEGHFTTPEAPEVQAYLAQFRDAGLTHAVVESSSHGFAQHRLDEIAYDIGVWTNLTPEHLDFHKSFDAYREAKMTLMRRSSISILNADDLSFPYFAGAAKHVVSYSIEREDTAWRATDIQVEAGLLRWRLNVQAEDVTSEADAVLPMVGTYNIYNALAALAAAHKAGLDLHLLLERLARFPGVPGRMQVVQREPFAVVVDFAHTPDSLQKALMAVRPQVEGRLIVVIGSAGERDPGKRAPLGETAVRYADIAILTEEDHRSESLDAILQRMTEGARQAGGREGETFFAIPDRRTAIREAIGMAQEGDLVLLAGKGHEATLERTHETLPWNEVEEAQQALQQFRDR